MEGELVALVQQLPSEVTEALSIVRADAQALSSASGNAAKWAELSDDDALHLLLNLHCSTPDDWQRWRALPMHRRTDGSRVAVDEQTYRMMPDEQPRTIPPVLFSKLQILNPEREVAHLYGSVPQLTDSRVLGLMLKDDAPERFADDIVNSIRGHGREVLLWDRELPDLLRRSPWLPLKSGGGTAPDNLLVAPGELLTVLSELGRAAAFGSCILPRDVDEPFWLNGERVVRTILGNSGEFSQLKRIEKELHSTTAVRVSGGAYAVVGDENLVDAEFVTDAMQTALVREHRGWQLIATFANALAAGPRQGPHDDSYEASKLLVAFARKLCGPVTAAQQAETLRTVSSERPPKDSSGGRTFERLLKAFAGESGLSNGVLLHIKLPAQDGNWYATEHIARSRSGVARRHLVLAHLRDALALDDDLPISSSRAVEDAGGRERGSEINTLRDYFERWRDRVPSAAIGRFLALLGAGLNKSTEHLAEEWLGVNSTLEAVRYQLTSAEGKDNPAAAVGVWVSSQVADGERTVVVNVLGDWVPMEVSATDTLFAVDSSSQTSFPLVCSCDIGWVLGSPTTRRPTRAKEQQRTPHTAS